MAYVTVMNFRKPCVSPPASRRYATVAMPPAVVSASSRKSANGSVSVATHSWQLVMGEVSSRTMRADID